LIDYKLNSDFPFFTHIQFLFLNNMYQGSQKIKNYLNNFKIAHPTNSYWGRAMYEFIWHWTKGNKKIYTRKIEIAEKAMKDGYLVMGVKEKPRIFKA